MGKKRGRISFQADSSDLSCAAKFKSKCRLNPKLLPLKLLMLLIYGAMTALYPYLTLHMKAIGLSMTEISIISAIVPFVSCIGPPLGGALADKIGNYKVTLMGFNIFSIAVHMLMFFAVPSLRLENHITAMNATFNCIGMGRLDFTNFAPGQCDETGARANQWPHNRQHNITILDCETASLLPADSQICLQADRCHYIQDLVNRTFRAHEWEQIDGESFWTLKVTNSTFAANSSTCYADGKNSPFLAQCRIKTDFQETCDKAGSVKNRYITLGLYATFRFLGFVAVSMVVPILDAAAYKMSENHAGDLGFQRIFTLIGMCVFPPLSGFLVGLSSKWHEYSDYSPAFYVFGLMNLLSVIITFFTDLSLEEGQQNIWKNIGKIMKNPKVSIFVIMMFLAGCAWGFLENLLFVFMEEDLHAPKWLMGMSNTVSSIAAIPVVAVSTYIMRVFGHTKIIVLCFLLYGCRFISYSVIRNPLHILPVEALEAFTTSLLWVVASVHCGKIAPDYLATLQGVIGCMHHAMGRGVGSLIGGIMFDHLKPRPTYQIFAGACGLIGALYFVLHYAWLRNIPNPQKEDPATPLEVGDTSRPSTVHKLSPADEELLRKFARQEAFGRRYSVAPVLVESIRTEAEVSESRKGSTFDGRRRRSTLVPVFFPGL